MWPVAMRMSAVPDEPPQALTWGCRGVVVDAVGRRGASPVPVQMWAHRAHEVRRRQALLEPQLGALRVIDVHHLRNESPAGPCEGTKTRLGPAEERKPGSPRDDRQRPRRRHGIPR